MEVRSREGSLLDADALAALLALDEPEKLAAVPGKLPPGSAGVGAVSHHTARLESMEQVN